MGLHLNGAGIETLQMTVNPSSPARACVGLLLNGAGIETVCNSAIPLLFPCLGVGLLLNGAGIETAPITYVGRLSSCGPAP